MDRRAFLLRVAAGVGAVGLGAWWLYDRVAGTNTLRVSNVKIKDVKVADKSGERRMPDKYKATLAAMVGRLLPDDPDGVGGLSTNAWGYIERELQHQELDGNFRLLMRGAVQLDRVASAEAGKPFLKCSADEQDKVIVAMQAGAGALPLFHPNDFVEVMVARTLEGFLCDPVHGGNKDGAGWTWTGYAMHNPRPGEACHPGPEAVATP